MRVYLEKGLNQQAKFILASSATKSTDKKEKEKETKKTQEKNNSNNDDKDGKNTKGTTWKPSINLTVTTVRKKIP